MRLPKYSIATKPVTAVLGRFSSSQLENQTVCVSFRLRGKETGEQDRKRGATAIYLKIDRLRQDGCRSRFDGVHWACFCPVASGSSAILV
jgi:hypothetical protein